MSERGCILLATSDRPPERLLPGHAAGEALATLIRRRCTLHTLRDDHSQLWVRHLAHATWFSSPFAAADLRRAFKRLARGQHARPSTLQLGARQVHVPLAAPGVCAFPFKQLCGPTTSLRTFLALANRFPAVLVEAVALPRTHEAAARKWVDLVDTLYHHKIRLLCSSPLPLEALLHEWGIRVEDGQVRIDPHETEAAGAPAPPPRPAAAPKEGVDVGPGVPRSRAAVPGGGATVHGLPGPGRRLQGCSSAAPAPSPTADSDNDGALAHVPWAERLEWEGGRVETPHVSGYSAHPPPRILWAHWLECRPRCPAR